MQKIVLFIEPNEDAFQTPFKSGHLFMNRFSIGEEANFEIVKIFCPIVAIPKQFVFGNISKMCEWTRSNSQFETPSSLSHECLNAF